MTMRVKTRSKGASIHALIWLSALVSPADVLRAEIADRPPRAESGQGTTDALDDMPAAELGYRFLATRETLRGQLGDTYRTLKELEAEGALPEFSLSYVMRYPDGTRASVRLSSLQELERMIKEVREAHEFYAGLVRFRTSRSLESSYRAVVSSNCPRHGFVSGPVEVRPDGGGFSLVQEGRAFNAVMVDATVVVTFPSLPLSPLAGAFHGNEVELEDRSSTCAVLLVAPGGSSPTR